MKTTLLIMAAGSGGHFGTGIKQLVQQMNGYRSCSVDGWQEETKQQKEVIGNQVVYKINNSRFQTTRVILDFSHHLQWMHCICCQLLMWEEGYNKTQNSICLFLSVHSRYFPHSFLMQGAWK